MPEANRNCKLCGKRFYAKPNWVARGNGKYCSRICQYEAQRTGTYVFCDYCRKRIWRTRRDVKRAKTKTYFCSKSCMLDYWNSYRSGHRHPNWIDGRYIEYRTILIEAQVKPVCMKCGKNDRRVLLAHHIDKNRQNSTLSNLVWLCYNCHYLVHKHQESVS